MTGTPLDLTPFGPLLSALGLLYWLLATAVVAFALWYPTRWSFKLSFSALVLAAFIYPILRHAQLKQIQRDESNTRLDTAMALFDERCKTAGEKITRTVKNVDGVVWMKWRDSNDKTANLYIDQFKLFDPYGRDCGAEECIVNLLRPPKGMEHFSAEAASHRGGYQFVESIDPSGDQRYRYSGQLTPGSRWTPENIAKHKRETGRDLDPDAYRFTLKREPIDRFTARYGITWNDISTREDREHWIAGGALTVIDLQTNEVIAKRVGYLIDTGQGSTAGFRSPWGWAQSYAPRCPQVDVHLKDFVANILQPTKKGE